MCVCVWGGGVWGRVVALADHGHLRLTKKTFYTFKKNKNKKIKNWGVRTRRICLHSPVVSVAVFPVRVAGLPLFEICLNCNRL